MGEPAPTDKVKPRNKKLSDRRREHRSGREMARPKRFPASSEEERRRFGSGKLLSGPMLMRSY